MPVSFNRLVAFIFSRLSSPGSFRIFGALWSPKLAFDGPPDSSVRGCQLFGGFSLKTRFRTPPSLAFRLYLPSCPESFSLTLMLSLKKRDPTVLTRLSLPAFPGGPVKIVLPVPSSPQLPARPEGFLLFNLFLLGLAIFPAAYLPLWFSLLLMC